MSFLILVAFRECPSLMGYVANNGYLAIAMSLILYPMFAVYGGGTVLLWLSVRACL
ncbi:hypothetical protein B0O99DRAFT_614987 [Bisporella sp. PMI_857]|nr:hypothetical protein B0O99DRAFT_614987 [Bisporella sp. PMI_857]